MTTAAKAVKTQGTVLSYSLGSPTSWVAFGKVTGFDGPGGASTVVEQSDLDDTTYKRKFTSLIDAGELQLDVNFDPAAASHAALKSAQEAGTQLEIKITPPSGSLSCYFNAYVSNLRIAAPADGKYTAKISLVLDGGYNWA